MSKLDEWLKEACGKEIVRCAIEANQLGEKSIITDSDLFKAVEMIRVMREALDEVRLNHTHLETDEHFQKMGDSYGWCHWCHTKVGVNEDLVRDALDKVEEIAGRG